jgi:hypothetical protein
MLKRGLSFLLVVAVVACSVGPRNGAGAEPLPPSSTPTFSVQSNVATGVVAGQQAGYGIRTLGGNVFRIIWTGDANVGGGYHEFWGTMWTTGTFSNEVPGCSANFCALESGDFVSDPYATAGGQRIDWDTFASDGLDGFEVTTSAVPVYFDMFIDGARYSNLVFYPDAKQNGAIASPTAVPFGITTQ